MKRWLIAFSCSVFVALVLPLQTYLGNRSEYGFSLAPILTEGALLACALTVALLALLWASDRWLRGWLTPLLVGLLAGLYLESGILSADIPEIDGDVPAALKNFWLAVGDLLVLIVVMAGAFFGYRRLRSKLAYVAPAVLLLGLASLGDANQASGAADTAEDTLGGRAVTQDIVRSLEFSPTRNVLLCVVDSVAATVASEIVSADPALAAKFPGFTAYRNNIGMHGSTKHGVPGLMTGLYCGDDDDVDAYMNSVLSPNSALEDYRRADAAIYCTFDMLSCGYTTSSAAVAASAARVDADARGPVLLRPAKGFPYMSIGDVMTFRAVPRLCKPMIVNDRLHTRRFMRNAGKSFLYGHNLYGALSQRPVSSDPRLMFAKVHVHGAHMPMLFDSEGKVAKAAPVDYTAYRQAVSNALVHLSRAMDDLRAKGVYDHSLVIVTTDHGSRENVDPSGRHPQASALLWIKPESAKGPWRDSESKTSHAGIASVLKAAAARSLTLSEIEPMLRSDDRVLSVRRKKAKGFDTYHY